MGGYLVVGFVVEEVVDWYVLLGIGLVIVCGVFYYVVVGVVFFGCVGVDDGGKGC